MAQCLIRFAALLFCKGDRNPKHFVQCLIDDVGELAQSVIAKGDSGDSVADAGGRTIAGKLRIAALRARQRTGDVYGAFKLERILALCEAAGVTPAMPGNVDDIDVLLRDIGIIPADAPPIDTLDRLEIAADEFGFPMPAVGDEAIGELGDGPQAFAGSAGLVPPEEKPPEENPARKKKAA